MLEFSHIGLITTEPKPGEVFVEATRVWVTNFVDHPLKIEWLRFEPDSPVTGPGANNLMSLIEWSQSKPSRRGWRRCSNRSSPCRVCEWGSICRETGQSSNSWNTTNRRFEQRAHEK